jgi:hypothetical protein
MSWFGVHNTRGLYVGTVDPDERFGHTLADQIRRALAEPFDML